MSSRPLHGYGHQEDGNGYLLIVGLTPEELLSLSAAPLALEADPRFQPITEVVLIFDASREALRRQLATALTAAGIPSTIEGAKCPTPVLFTAGQARQAPRSGPFAGGPPPPYGPGADRAAAGPEQGGAAGLSEGQVLQAAALTEGLRAWLRARPERDMVLAAAVTYELCALIARHARTEAVAVELIDAWAEVMREQVRRLGVGVEHP